MRFLLSILKKFDHISFLMTNVPITSVYLFNKFLILFRHLISIFGLHHHRFSIRTYLLSFYMFWQRLWLLKLSLLPFLLFYCKIFDNFRNFHIIQILIQLFHTFTVSSKNSFSQTFFVSKCLKNSKFKEITPALSETAYFFSFFLKISFFFILMFDVEFIFDSNFIFLHLLILNVPSIFKVYFENHIVNLA